MPAEMRAGTVAAPSPSSALQAVLAGEHAAVYAYGVVGAVVDPTGPIEARTRDAYDEHRARRDRVEWWLLVLGDAPTPAEPGYGLAAPVSSAVDGEQLARLVEDRCAVLYATVVAVSADALRREAAGWLEDAATRALAWGAAATAFPGVGRPAARDLSR